MAGASPRQTTALGGYILDNSKLNNSDNHLRVIEIEGLNKWFGSFHVLRDVSLSVEQGEKIVICGPSGSGKSTLIRCINFLEEHQEGQIVVDGIELSSSNGVTITVNDLPQPGKLTITPDAGCERLNTFLLSAKNVLFIVFIEYFKVAFFESPFS